MKPLITGAAWFLLFLLGASFGSAQTPAALPWPAESKAQRNERMAWWREAKFGMFIHWGVYSVPAGIYHGQPVAGLGEWIMNKGKIPVADYAAFAGQFNPVKFDAEAWVQMAQDAGVRYIVITAKHHDGFAMYRTAVSPYNIVDATPFHRDPLRELAAACRAHGIRLGFYYSQDQDWHQPGGGAYGGHWDPAQEGDFDQYLAAIAVPEVKELLSNYGPDVPAVLWFDTPKDMTPARAALFQPVLALKPNLIVNNRLGRGYAGDTETPEQRIPPQGFPGKDWETCMTVNDTWGYKANDTNWKSPDSLLRNLIDIASHGGNYLLNVGPTSEGVIPAPEVERLRAMGAWLKVNGDAIYGSSPTIFGSEAGAFSVTEKDKKGNPAFIAKWEWRCTTKPGKIYIHFFKWPGGKWSVAGVASPVTRAYLLADPQHGSLPIVQTGQSVTIGLPDQAPDPIASVLCLETAPWVLPEARARRPAGG
jgi:alpha-L-fucosidase